MYKSFEYDQVPFSHNPIINIKVLYIFLSFSFLLPYLFLNKFQMVKSKNLLVLYLLHYHYKMGKRDEFINLKSICLNFQFYGGFYRTSFTREGGEKHKPPAQRTCIYNRWNSKGAK